MQNGPANLGGLDTASAVTHAVDKLTLILHHELHVAVLLNIGGHEYPVAQSLLPIDISGILIGAGGTRGHEGVASISLSGRDTIGLHLFGECENGVINDVLGAQPETEGIRLNSNGTTERVATLTSTIT